MDSKNEMCLRVTDTGEGLENLLEEVSVKEGMLAGARNMPIQ